MLGPTLGQHTTPPRADHFIDSTAEAVSRMNCIASPLVHPTTSASVLVAFNRTAKPGCATDPTLAATVDSLFVVLAQRAGSDQWEELKQVGEGLPLPVELGGMRCAAGVLAVQDDPGSTVELSELLARRALMMAAECADAVAKSVVRHGVKLNTSGGRCVPLDLIFAWCAQ